MAGRSENGRSFPTPGLDEASQSFAKDHEKTARLAELDLTGILPRGYQLSLVPSQKSYHHPKNAASLSAQSLFPEKELFIKSQYRVVNSLKALRSSSRRRRRRPSCYHYLPSLEALWSYTLPGSRTILLGTISRLGNWGCLSSLCRLTSIISYGC
jgi:hypothetical protein